jgi:hypothetical protein
MHHGNSTSSSGSWSASRLHRLVTQHSAWFAVFFVFMVSYPEVLEKTCKFLEKYIVHLKTTVSGTFDRLASRLILN